MSWCLIHISSLVASEQTHPRLLCAVNYFLVHGHQHYLDQSQDKQLYVCWVNGQSLQHLP